MKCEVGNRNQEKATADFKRSEIGLFVAGIALLALLVVTVLIPAFQGTLVLDPIAFRVGPVEVRWYGIILALAIGVAYEWSRRRLVQRGINLETGEAVLWWAAIGGIVGSRVGYVLQNLDSFAVHPLDAFALTQGGLSIHGGVIGGALAVYLAGRRLGIRFLTWADLIAPTVLLGTIIGRFGNFANYELYGYPTELPWKMFVPITYRLPGFESSVFFHPTFLYEALLNLAMLGIIIWYERWITRREHSGSELGNHSPGVKEAGDLHGRSGSVFWVTLALYSVSRFFVEFFRIGHPLDGGLTLAQWVSLAVIAVGLTALTRRSGVK